MPNPAPDFVPSEDNPLLPKQAGYVYGSILPFRAKESLAHPGQAMPGTGELALPDIIRSSINELTSAVTLPGRTALGQVDPATLPQQGIHAAVALSGAGLGARALPSHELLDPLTGALKAPEGWSLHPVDHDPFTAGPARIATEHGQMMDDLTSEAYARAVPRGPGSGQGPVPFTVTGNRPGNEHQQMMQDIYTQALSSLKKKAAKEKKKD